MKSSLYSFLLLLLALAPVGGAESDLQKGFENPPDSAKPRTWWHWVSGNVSSEGITADLQAMKKAGLGGAQMFTVDQSAVKGPIVFLSPEWRKLMHQSLVEAEQLKLEISIEGCDGWSESGGHWVTPAQSMQKVVWTETKVEGGKTIPLELPKPETTRDYYEDIGIFAFPTITGEEPTAAPQYTASPAEFSPKGSTMIRVSNTTPKQPFWVDCTFAQPITCRSLTLQIKNWGDGSGELQASDDGVTFRKICGIQARGTFGFAATTGKVFRIWFPKAPDKPAQFDFTKIEFGGPRVSDVTARTGMAVKVGLPFDEMPFTAAEMIDPKALVDLTGKKEWAAPAGDWTLVRMGHTSTGATTHPSTSPGLECDKLSRAAVESHIKNLFGPVWEDSPAQTGKSLRYILLDSWEAGCENWTPLMREEFKKRRGYDLTPWLPTLTGRVVTNLDATERFLWDYRRTLADLVAENHYKVFQDAAHAHKMGLTSEATGIGMPTVADQLQCKGYCDIPMGEFWVDRNDPRKEDANIDDPKETASAAHIYGQNIAAAESFTASPENAAWSNDPNSLKLQGDKEFCLGINRYVFHRYAHQPWLDRLPGMSMGPWGINFERTNTWWNQGSAWIDYISRCQYLLQRGRFVGDLVYFYGEDAPICFHRWALKPGVPKGYDYDVCDAETLRRMSVEKGAIALKSGMRYRVLVLPDTDRITLPLLQKVQALVKAGAVVYGPKPAKSPSLTGYPGADTQIQAIVGEVWGDCDGKTVTEHAYGSGRVVWGKPLEKVLNAPADFLVNQPRVSFIHRVDGDADIYFVSNQDNKERVVQCSFRVTGKAPELWHPDTGKTEAVAFYRDADGRTSLPIHFDQAGSVFVIFRGPTAKDPVVMITRDGAPLGYAPMSSKIVIQSAQYGLLDDPARSRDVRDRLQACVDQGQILLPVSNELAGEDPAPNVVKSLRVEYLLDGKPKTITATEIETIDLDPQSGPTPFAGLSFDAKHAIVLKTEQAGHYEMTRASGGKIACDVPPLAKPVDVAGPWKVTFPPKLGAPESADFPSLVSWTESTVEGIKYFSGTATYRSDATIPDGFLGKDRRAVLDLGEVKNLAEVSVNGKALGVLWKAPFRLDITDAVKTGANQVEIKVTNLWPNRLIGDQKLPKEQRITWASVDLYKADSPLLPSGLLGPVRIVPAQEVTLAP